jgi:hypothetical protein
LKVKNRFWLRGLVTGIAAFSGFSGAASFAQYHNGFQPAGYPYAVVGQNGQPINIGSYPSLAQNTPGGHVHVPQGSFNGDPIGNLLPMQLPAPQTVAPQVTPLPPVHSPTPSYSQFLPTQASTAPMYAVPPQSAPIQASSSQPIPQSIAYSSCASCNQGTIYSGIVEGYGPAPTVGCGPSVFVPQVVNVNPWFFGAGALIFQREDNEYVRLSSNVTPGAPAIPGASVLTTLDARMRTSGGFQAFGGRYFGCGRYAVMGSYWGLYPADQSVTVIDTTGVGVGTYFRTDLPLTISSPGGANEHGIEMPTAGTLLGPDGGRTGYDWMTNSFAQRLTRSQGFNNVEVNFFSFGLGGAARNGYAVGGRGHHLGGGQRYGYTSADYGNCGGCGSCGASAGCGSCQPCAAACSGPTSPCGPITGAQCSRLRVSWLGGVRWLRFNDYLEYAASDNDSIFGNGDDFYYRNTLRNDLLGFQLGGLANYCCGSRVNLYASSKAGIYGNRVTFDSFAGTDSTTAIISSYNAAYDNHEYAFQSTKTSLAFLGEVETGVGINITRGLTATCGYRVVGISGVATAPGQIPNDFSDFNAVRRIQDNGSVLLHGLSIGGMYNW